MLFKKSLFFNNLESYLKTNDFDIYPDEIIISTRRGKFKDFEKKLKKCYLSFFKSFEIINYNNSIEFLTYLKIVRISKTQYHDLSCLEQLMFSYDKIRDLYYAKDSKAFIKYLKNSNRKIFSGILLQYKYYFSNNSSIKKCSNGFKILVNDYYNYNGSLLDYLYEKIKNLFLDSLDKDQICRIIKECLYVKSFEVSIYLNNTLSIEIFNLVKKGNKFMNYYFKDESFYLNKNTKSKKNKIFYDVKNKEHLTNFIDKKLFKIEFKVSNENNYIEKKLVITY